MKKTVIVLSVSLAIVISLVVAGFSARAQQPQQPSEHVKIDNFSFAPATITVPAGTTLTWTNRDDIPHTVVDDKKEFKSKVLDTNDEFSYTFTKSGTYSYFCSLHPKMTGKVVVQ